MSTELKSKMVGMDGDKHERLYIENSEDAMWRETHSHESAKLTFDVFYDSKTRKVSSPLIEVRTEYFYGESTRPHGRKQYVGISLSPDECRRLAHHLNAMADRANNA